MTVYASVEAHALEVRPILHRDRRTKQPCGCCGGRMTHEVYANGINMGWAGCEMQAWRNKRRLEQSRGFR